MQPETFAALVETCVKQALAPLQQRLAVLDTQLQTVVADAAALQTKTATLAESVVRLDTREPQPGPAGPPGPAGQDGAPGKAGMTYCGVYVDGKEYEPGDVVTWAGSAWHCGLVTRGKPQDGSREWTLIVKRGRDGKDGKP